MRQRGTNISVISTEQGIQNNVPFVSLGHELSHAEDDFKGTLNIAFTWRGDYKKYPEAEKYATHRENQIRSSSGLPLRKHYGTVILPGQDAYTPDERTRIINSNGQSIYYPEVNYKKR